MIDELELLRRHIDATVDSDPDLEPMRRSLVAAIDAEGEAARPPKQGDPDSRRRSRLTRRTTLSLGGLMTACVTATLVALLVTSAPPAPHGTPEVTTKPFPSHLSVRDQLRLVADRAAEQPIPHLQSDQALYSRANLSIVANVNNSAAQATIGLSVQKWSTASGQTCTSLTAQPAQFASPSAQADWVGLHLLTSPNPPTASQCLGGGGGAAPPDAITGAGQLIDVSPLPTDPSTLSQDLESGTTGIPTLDQLLPDEAAPNPGFQRAATLLIGPTLGATPQFDAALYEAIALLPGVTALGPMTTHDGEAGQGFASGPGSGQSIIVVDPSTGQLLEVRGLDDSDSLTSIATHYLDGGPMVVTEYSDQLQWLDPVGSPSVMSLSDLPAGLPVYVFATTRTGVTYADAMAPVQNLAKPYSSFFTSSQGGVTDQTNPNSPWQFQWSFAGPGPVVGQFMQVLRASGLFASVSEI
jgi:hypothetical protein